MVLNAYSVLDVKAADFGPVFLAANDRLAERTVLESLRGGQSLLCRYPEDFLLYRLGSFDSSSGVISGENPVIIVAVKDLVRKETALNAQGA